MIRDIDIQSTRFSDICCFIRIDVVNICHCIICNTSRFINKLRKTVVSKYLFEVFVVAVHCIYVEVSAYDQLFMWEFLKYFINLKILCQIGIWRSINRCNYEVFRSLLRDINYNFFDPRLISYFIEMKVWFHFCINSNSATRCRVPVVSE
jgi:hypothetical protein